MTVKLNVGDVIYRHILGKVIPYRLIILPSSENPWFGLYHEGSGRIKCRINVKRDEILTESEALEAASAHATRTISGIELEIESSKDDLAFWKGLSSDLKESLESLKLKEI